jgi:hypothetical protein
VIALLAELAHALFIAGCAVFGPPCVIWVVGALDPAEERRERRLPW